ncbi:DEDD exonuclease domain-containing protein [Luteococcus sanguinis]|uniref:DEDD exonuclease domain-containing protein n=1 Tax=Luteococcus sanguinis TaxID=174038 RepID=A0ABW1X312_9ACTN
MPTTAAYRADQPSFDDLGTPLSQITFCVVDLETTGSGPEAQITEIGAVKVCGGEVVGEYQTLVNPGGHIPAVIAVLTGITNAMVATQPRIAQVLPSFLEFARGTVLVAHNAGFDIGFLKRACAEHGQSWQANAVVDTVALARQVLLRDEVPNCQLSTLAAHFGATTVPNHRALSDARATVDVLHALVERVGNLGVDTLEDLTEFTHRVSPQRRAKRAWAKELPTGPGVYCFYADQPDGSGGMRREILYVGKSKSIRTRVRTYFTASEKRGRMEEMVRVASGVEAHPCVTPLEAEVRELRMIAAHSPRYNRRSRNQDRLLWVKLTKEAFPRLSVVRRVSDDGCHYWGPFSSRQAADDALLAIYDAFPIRQCTQRLSARRPAAGCALGEMGRCLAPCQLGEQVVRYADLIDRLRSSLGEDVRPVLGTVGVRLRRLVDQQRYEEAQVVSQRLAGYARASVRHQRVRSIARLPQLVAAQWDGLGWQIHVVRHGRLAAAARALPGEVPQAVAREAVSRAETVLAPVGGWPAGSVEECERIAAWLETPGVRLMEVDGEWSWPIHVGLGQGDLARLTVGAAQPVLAG